MTDEIAGPESTTAQLNEQQKSHIAEKLRIEADILKLRAQKRETHIGLLKSGASLSLRSIMSW